MVEEEMTHSNEKTFAILTLCGIIGIILAIVEQLLFNEGIIIDKFIMGTFALREIQFGTIFIWEMFGIGVAAIEQ